MKKHYINNTLILLIFFLCLTFLPFVFAESEYSKIPESLTVSKILQNQNEWDGKEITFIGEVIGQALYIKDHAWINVMDCEFNAMGCWVPKSETAKILFFGKYGKKGDIIEIKGLFNKTCVEHGGDTDIHCDLIHVLEKGKLLSNDQISIGYILFSILLLFAIGFLYKFPFLRKKRD